MAHWMLGRWMPGWTVSGALGALVIFEALETGEATEWSVLERNVAVAATILIGGPVAVSVGAYLSAKWQKRAIVREIRSAGGASFVGAALFLFLVELLPANQTVGNGLTRSDALLMDIVAASGVFGWLYGLSMARYRSNATRWSKAGISLGTAGAAIFGSLSIFIASYVLGGGTMLQRFLPDGAAVPLGVAIGGFMGSLLPGILVEHLLNMNRSSGDQEKEI